MCHYCWDRGATPRIAEVEQCLGWEEGEGFRMHGGLLKLSTHYLLRKTYLGKLTITRLRHGQKLFDCSISPSAPLNDPTKLTHCSSFGTLKNMRSIETLLAGALRKLLTTPHVSVLTIPTEVARISP